MIKIELKHRLIDELKNMTTHIKIKYNLHIKIKYIKIKIWLHVKYDYMSKLNIKVNNILISKQHTDKEIIFTTIKQYFYLKKAKFDNIYIDVFIYKNI